VVEVMEGVKEGEGVMERGRVIERGRSDGGGGRGREGWCWAVVVDRGRSSSGSGGVVVGHVRLPFVGARCCS
jgi:hypothetical protein